MTKEQLLELAKENGIKIYEYNMTNKKAFCVEKNIVMDHSRIESEEEETAILKEQIAFILGGCLYTLKDIKNEKLVKQLTDEAREYARRNLS